MTTNDSSGDGPSPLIALGMVGDLLISIALPTSLFALLGRWLDAKLHASPWFTIGGLLISVVIVSVIVSIKAEKLRKQLYPKQ